MWNPFSDSERCHQGSADQPQDHQCLLEDKPHDHQIQQDEKDGSIFFWLFLIPYVMLLLL